MDNATTLLNSTAGNSYTMFDSDGSTITFNLIYHVILTFLGVLIIFANGLVVLIYAESEMLRRKSANLLLFNQSLVDLFHGIVTNGITLFGNQEFVARQIIYQFSLALGLHTAVLVSIERYVFILKPLIHKRMVTIGRMRTAVIVTWFSSLLWIPFRMAHLTDSDVDLKSYIIFYIAISDAIFFVLIVLMAYLHVSMYKAVLNFMKARHSKIVVASIRRSSSYHRKTQFRCHIKELRVTKIFLSMFIAFIVSYLPVFVTGLIHISGKSTTFSADDFNYMSLDVVFYLCNCVFNPLVTIGFKEDYRSVFIRWTSVLRRIICHQVEREKYECSYEKVAWSPTFVEKIATSIICDRRTINDDEYAKPVKL